MRRTARSPIAVVLVTALTAACWLGAPPPQAVAQQAKPSAAGQSQERRLQQLEDQMLDLQAMIGTLQSLVKNGTVPDQPTVVAPAAPAPVASPSMAGGDVDQRVNVIETQIRALSGQMEQITAQLAQLQAALGGGAVPQQPDAGLQDPVLQPQGQLQPGDANPLLGQTQPPFGTLTVEPDQAAPQTALNQAPTLQVPSGAPAPDPATRAVYEAAYDQLLQRDFKGAEAGFRDFLATYPEDPLAANAQYWLGETYYVRGKYREAADSFLAGYRKYRNSDKGPASLLKLAMSLGQLGQKDAACATFGELSQKFPNAPQHLKQRAASESSRTGC